MAKKLAKKKINKSEKLREWLSNAPTMTLTQALLQFKKLGTTVDPQQFYKVRREIQEKQDNNDVGHVAASSLSGLLYEFNTRKNTIPDDFGKDNDKNADKFTDVFESEGGPVDLVSLLKARRVLSDALCEVRTLLGDSDGISCVVIYDVMDEFMDVFEDEDEDDR